MLDAAVEKGAQAVLQAVGIPAASAPASNTNLDAPMVREALTNLDSRIAQQGMPFSEGETEMAKRIKQRVQIGNETKWATGTTQQDVLLNAARILKDAGMLETNMPQQETPLFRDYAEEWFVLYKLPKLRRRTAILYRNTLTKHILPFFGNMHLADITTSDIQRFYNTKSALAHSTVRQMGIIVHQVLSSAVEDGILSRNPTESKRLTMSTAKSERAALLPEDAQDIVCNLSKLD